MFKFLTLTLLAAGWFSSAAHADVAGTVVVSTVNDTLSRVEITGDAAQALYETIKRGNSEFPLARCEDTTVVTGAGVACRRIGSTYDCVMSVNARGETTVLGYRMCDGPLNPSIGVGN